MKSNRKLKAAGAALALLLAPHALATPAVARQEDGPPQKTEKQKGRDDEAKRKRPRRAESERDDDVRLVQSAGQAEDAPTEADKVREKEEVSYYNNFLTSYRLGPEDVISVKVFGLERYDKANIIVPPDGKVDYYFVRGGLQVAGKTTQEVADEITKHLDEYIREPQVTVSLDKAMSARYYVIGDVATPGIRIMSRRLSAYEAIMESGGVLATGDKKRVTVSRLRADGIREFKTVDIAAIEKGKAPDNYHLRPGDVVVVPGNRYKTVKKVLDLLPVISFARIFTGGF